MLQLLSILILISAFPLGYLLAYLCRDELVQGRRWFLSLVVLGLVASLIVTFIRTELKLVLILGLFYVSIVSLISMWKSYDKKFICVSL